MPDSTPIAVNLHVPAAGTLLRLEEPWSFDLHANAKNQSFWRAMGFPNPYLAEPYRWESLHDTAYQVVTLPVGVGLILERIFVRPGDADGSMVSFRIDSSSPTPIIRKRHLCVSLADCNKIVCVITPPTQEVEITGSIWEHPGL